MITPGTLTHFSLDSIEYLAKAITEDATSITPGEAEDLLGTVSPTNPLLPLDAARFLVTENGEVDEILFQEAGRVKREVFGPRIVIFAPLYLSSRCSNNCLYCGFRRDNRSLMRKTLTPKEAAEEAGILASKGYMRLLLVCGESYSRGPVEYIGSIVEEIYSRTDMRILHLNAAPMKVEELRKIKESGVGVYQVFQETYHRDTYRRMHPSGNKANYEWRLTCMDRAMEAGFDDVGIGALLGLYEWKFETISTILHSIYLKERYHTWPHTISVPRLKPASGTPLEEPPFPVSDRDFLKIVAIYRLSSPPSGVVISTREHAALRDRTLSIGASQISAGSKTTPGGYGPDTLQEKEGQFVTDDKRGLEEIIRVIIEEGMVPSLCTSCYRSGRTGAAFTQKATKGEMGDLCHANALLSIAEYSLLTNDEDLSRGCRDLLEKEGDKLPGYMEDAFRKKLALIMEGKTDERF